MSDVDHRLIAQLMQEGAPHEALSLLEQSFKTAELAVAPTRSDIFMTMFQLQLLAEQHEPARIFLRNVRDTQVERLLAGDIYFGLDIDPPAEEFSRIRRFSLIVDINDTLGDQLSTCEVFSKLDLHRPELARRNAWSALPALVAEGRFALADRYREDPLKSLAMVNEIARALPLYPPLNAAPRLAAELTNLARDVRIGMAVLRGLGAEHQADTLREALAAGLDSDELKELAQRELDAPGTITRVISDHRMALEKDGA